ncbi:MAG: nuclear transport factor 2 family protein [Alphaproteobacteria bacterium]|nr:MAG: nuclear transport factor 2 family protein [Alphaproteobacteria bacterium]
MTNPDAAFLAKYADAWNAHDADAIMDMMTEDCVFETGSGARFTGVEEVRNRFEAVWQDVPDVQFENDVHFASGNRGCSEWVFTGTSESGAKLKIPGSDHFVFKDGKIWIKSTYLKQT